MLNFPRLLLQSLVVGLLLSGFMLYVVGWMELSPLPNMMDGASEPERFKTLLWLSLGALFAVVQCAFRVLSLPFDADDEPGSGMGPGLPIEENRL